jgi:spore coat protein H
LKQLILVFLVLLALTSGCGKETLNGSGSTNPGTVTPPVTTTSVFSQAEAAAVADSATTYAVEDTTKVINATITTFDGTYTFAQVNSDIDPNDTFVPEVDAHFVADDYPVADPNIVNATLRLRGSSSRLADQKSYRLKLKTAAPLWRGETTLQLNKHPWDLTRVRNKLAFDLFKDIPHLPSLRTQFMHVWINGQDYGLFTHVEKMGKEYLSNRGLAVDGNIYKANNFSFEMEPGLALDAAGKYVSKDAFEKILELENDNKNHSNLIAMINAVNDETIPLNSTMQTYFDRNNYIVWLAVNILAGNRDTINQNFALYQPKDSTRFYFLPWDYDGAFGIENQPDFKAANNLYSPGQMGIGNWWGIPLHRRFVQDPQNRADLKRAVMEIYNSYLTNTRIQSKLNSYRAIVEPLITSSPDLDYLPVLSGTEKTDEWALEYARLITTIKTNYEQFLASLESPMPYWQSATVNGAQLDLAWDASVDFDNDPVTYSIQVADSPLFTSPLYSATGYSGLSVSVPKPATGTYYMKVTARDSLGNTIEAFDRYLLGNVAYFGVLEFQVP